MAESIKTPSRRKGFKGAVLIMVLAVMFVLLVMLTGAMAIVTTASKRTYTQFEESQSYYTARSGLEVVVNTLMQDDNFVDKQVNANNTNLSNKNDGDNSKSGNDMSDLDNYSQGRVLQEAIFGKLVTDASGNVYYDCSKSLRAWDGKDKYRIVYDKDGDGTIGSNEYDEKTYTTNDKKKSYMKFAVSDITAFANGEQGMLADSGDGTVEIRFQLMDLVYDDGTARGIHRDEVTTNQTAFLNSGNETTSYLRTYKLKVVCEATYNGVSTSVATILVQDVPVVSGNKAVVSPGYVDLTTGSNVFGGITTGGDFQWRNNGDVYDNIFINGDVNINAQKNFILGENNSITILGDMTIPNNLYIKGIKHYFEEAERSHPFVYVDGMIDAQSNTLVIGESGTKAADTLYKNVDLICGGLKTANGTSNFRVCGDTYIDGPLMLGMSNYPSTFSDPVFGGDLFISDLEGKSYLGSSGPNFSGDGYSMGYDGFTQGLLRDINLTGGAGFCSGNIYFYYSEFDLNGNGAINYQTTLREYEGCAPLGYLYIQLYNFVNGSDATLRIGNEDITNKVNAKKFLDKLHPIGYTIKYDAADANPLGNASPNVSALLYNCTPSAPAPVRVGESKAWDMRVNNIKYLVGLAGDVSQSEYYFCDDMEITTTSATIELDEEGNADIKLNIVVPKDNAQSITDRIAKDSNGTDSNLPKKANGDTYVYKLPTLLSEFYQYIAKKDSKFTGTLPASVDDGDFLNDARNGELQFTVYNRFITDEGLPAGDHTDTWDWFVKIVAKTMRNEYSKSKPFKDYVPRDYLNQMFDLCNSIYKSNGFDSTKGRSTFMRAETGFDAYNAATEKAKIQVSFWTPVEWSTREMGLTFTGNTVSTVDTSAAITTVTDGGGNAVDISSAFGNESSVYFVEPDATSYVLVLDPSKRYKGTLVVKGDQDLAIIAGPSNYTFEKFCVVTEQFYNEWKLGRDMHHTGDTGTDALTKMILTNYPTIETPNIRWYLDDGAAITVVNGAQLMGYTYGPFAKFKADHWIGHNGFVYHCNDTWSKTYSNQHLDFIGSMFMGMISVNNDYTILYVKPTISASPNGVTIPHQPHLYGNAGMDIVEYTGT